jgi:periplasmic divalent cation tolerance protein
MFQQFWLTCKDKTEASTIALVLLQKHLVVCAKQTAVSSDFLWNDNADHNDEVLLIMDSREDLFEQVEAEVARLHSYETFVLQAVPVARVSAKSAVWMRENLK